MVHGAGAQQHRVTWVAIECGGMQHRLARCGRHGRRTRALRTACRRSSRKCTRQLSACPTHPMSRSTPTPLTVIGEVGAKRLRARLGRALRCMPARNIVLHAGLDCIAEGMAEISRSWAVLLRCYRMWAGDDGRPPAQWHGANALIEFFRVKRIKKLQI